MHTIGEEVKLYARADHCILECSERDGFHTFQLRSIVSYIDSFVGVSAEVEEGLAPLTASAANGSCHSVPPCRV